jgi:hypothetical protein
MRPTSLRNLNHEDLVHQYHNQVAHTFKNFYADTNMPKWANKTDFLGQGCLETYESLPVPGGYQERADFHQPTLKETLDKKSVRFA